MCQDTQENLRKLLSKNETAAEIEIAEITPSDILTGCANLKVGDKIAAGGSVVFKVNVTDGKAVGDYAGTLVIKDTKGNNLYFDSKASCGGSCLHRCGDSCIQAISEF